MSDWLDRDDEYTEAINAAHPLKTGNHTLRAKANEMVGNRHSKGALVDLVNWQLVELTQARETIKKMAEVLEFYADGKNWEWIGKSTDTDYILDCGSEVQRDFGGKARAGMQLAKPWLEEK